MSVLYPSSDDTAVAGYAAQREIDGVWTDVASNNITSVYLRNLTPATAYTVRMVAFDAAGNRSAQSDPVTFTTRAVEPAQRHDRLHLHPLTGTGRAGWRAVGRRGRSVTGVRRRG